MKMGNKKKSFNQDIAIIGMSCRFPGAEDYSSYWHNLLQGKEYISAVPERSWDTGIYKTNNMQEKK